LGVDARHRKLAASVYIRGSGCGEKCTLGHVPTPQPGADGNLSRNLTRLQEAGYARITKRSGRHRTRTWISATDDGRRALSQEIAALEELIARVRPAAAPKLRSTARPATA
jgi:hypothetical protein